MFSPKHKKQPYDGFNMLMEEMEKPFIHLKRKCL